MKRLALLAAALFVLAPRAARADAAQDTKDIRAGKLPVRADWLGWDGRTAHFRTLVCSEGGTTSCTASVVKQSEVTTSSTELLAIDEVYCDGKTWCAALGTPVATAFAARERNALSALPPLAAGATASDPVRVFGNVLGEATRVKVRVRPLGKDGDPSSDVDLVLEGRDGAVERLGVVDARVYRLNSSAVDSAHLTGDGTHAAFVVKADVGVMCWDFSVLSTIVVDVARKKASLANTIAWRAYQKKDLGGALAGFKEATALDSSFALGWYNRAAVESRAGDTASARTSLAAAIAIDPSFTERARNDHDFDALRATQSPSPR